jgi:hypothetical protein
MKNITKKILGVGLVGLSMAGIALAANGEFGSQGKGMLQQNENLQVALDNQDYNGFISTLEEVNPRAAERMTEERFQGMVDRHEQRDAISDAVENNDYDAWVAAVSVIHEGEDISEIVSEDDFATLVAIHEAREDGDFETVNELREDLDFKPRFGRFGDFNGLGSEGRTSTPKEDGSGFGMRSGKSSLSRNRFKDFGANCNLEE